jgi:hypothetical protein
MQHLPYRLWIAISLSTLTIASTHPVSAKTPPKSIASQTNSKKLAPTYRLTPILGETGIKQPPSKSPRQKLSKIPSHKGKIDPLSLKSLANLTDADRKLDRSIDVSAVNRLIK